MSRGDALRRHMRDAIELASAAGTDDHTATLQVGVVIGLAMAGEADGWMTRQEAAGWRADAQSVMSMLLARARATAAGFTPSAPVLAGSKGE